MYISKTYFDYFDILHGKYQSPLFGVIYGNPFNIYKLMPTFKMTTIVWWKCLLFRDLSGWMKTLIYLYMEPCVEFFDPQNSINPMTLSTKLCCPSGWGGRPFIGFGRQWALPRWNCFSNPGSCETARKVPCFQYYCFFLHFFHQIQQNIFTKFTKIYDAFISFEYSAFSLNHRSDLCHIYTHIRSTAQDWSSYPCNSHPLGFRTWRSWSASKHLVSVRKLGGCSSLYEIHLYGISKSSFHVYIITFFMGYKSSFHGAWDEPKGLFSFEVRMVEARPLLWTPFLSAVTMMRRNC